MATPETIHCIGCAKDISKLSRDGRKLWPDSTQLQESKLCLDGSFSSGAAAAISLQSLRDQKGAGEEHSKGSFHTPLEGWQKHPSQQGKIW